MVLSATVMEHCVHGKSIGDCAKETSERLCALLWLLTLDPGRKRELGELVDKGSEDIETAVRTKVFLVLAIKREISLDNVERRHRYDHRNFCF